METTKHGIDSLDRPRNPHEDGGRYMPGNDPSWYEAVVIDVHPATHSMVVDITLADDQYKSVEVSVISGSYDPQSQAKEVSLYKRGTPVLVTNAPGYWVCIGVAPKIKFSFPKKSYQRAVTGMKGFGSEDEVMEDEISSNYRGQSAPDILPGDWGVQGTEGNFVGVLAGGLSIFKGGELSQIIASKLGDILKVIARNFQMFSDFGEFKLVNEDGKTGLVLNGYADATNANKHTNNWDYQLKLGGGGHLFSAKLGRAPNGDALFSFVIDTNGKARVMTHDSFTVEASKAPKIKYNSDKISDIGGSKIETISRSKITKVKGSETQNVGGIQKVLVTSGRSVQIGAESVRYIGTVAQEKIGGVPVYGTSTVAKNTDIGQGDITRETGNPLNPTIPAPIMGGKRGSFSDTTWIGDHSRTCMTAGNIEDTVLLAGNIKHTVTTGNITNEILTAGNITNSTKVGNLSFSTLAGTASLSSTLGTTLDSKLSKIKLTPDGKVALGNSIVGTSGSIMEITALLSKITELLGTTTAPGFGGPLSTMAQWQLLKADIDSLLKGSL